MRFAIRLVKILIWGVLAVAVLAAATSWFAFAVVTDSDTVTRLIQAELHRFFPNAEFEFSNVEFRPLRGKATLKQITGTQLVDGEQFPTISLPWLEVRFNAWAILQGEREPSEVVVSTPTLRLIQKRDGNWNLMDLPARPWPQTPIENAPSIEIHKGTVELVIESDDSNESALPANRETSRRRVAILRDVRLSIHPTDAGRLEFQGSARGDLLDRIELNGTIEPTTGDVDLSGKVVDLALSDTFRRRLPPEVITKYDALSISGGDLDVDVRSLSYRPGAAPHAQLSYNIGAQLRGAVCSCPQLPFPLNDLTANLSFRDGRLTINNAEGTNGPTRVRASGEMGLDDPEQALLNLHIEADDLDLDQRIRERTPDEFAELWDVFKPKGRVDVQVDVVRTVFGGPIALASKVDLKDVSGVYRHFPYPLTNLRGSLTLKGERLTLNLYGPVGDKPATLRGTVDHPGPDARVDLTINAESLPIDDAFLNALHPEEVRPWVDRFKPSGLVKATARIRRDPLIGPPPLKPEGRLVIDAVMDLDPTRCEITWEGLPFTIRNLQGKLRLHPDLWIFEDLQGRNGQAEITGSGKVQRLPGPDLPNGEPPLKIGMTLSAQNLPFSSELRKALPEAWQISWAFINPDGSCDVQAEIAIDPHGAGEEVRVLISPLPESNIRLVVPKAPEPDVEPGSTVELRMQNALGTFEFLNGKVDMTNVRFNFHGSPVQFAKGTVQVEDNGRFALAVSDLWVNNLLLNANLRKIMPALMAQAALKVDDGHPVTARGDLRIGWSGEPGEAAWCEWERATVILKDNSLKTGIPLEHINGQIKQIWGRSDGTYLEVHGMLDILSVSVSGLQVTKLEGPIIVKDGIAQLPSVKGSLLGGVLYGDGSIAIADTPRYAGSLRLDGADLQEYARNIPGRQTFRGVVNARAEFNGLGTDIRTLNGKGEGHIVDGDIGQLPFFLQIAKGFNSLIARNVPRGKSMFDSADLVFRMVNGTTYFDQIKLTGSAVSLEGAGTRDPLDNLDLSLNVLLGRNQYKIPILSRAISEAGGELFEVRITGTSAHPVAKGKPVPGLPRLSGRDRN